MWENLLFQYQFILMSQLKVSFETMSNFTIIIEIHKDKIASEIKKSLLAFQTLLLK